MLINIHMSLGLHYHFVISTVGLFNVLPFSCYVLYVLEEWQLLCHHTYLHFAFFLQQMWVWQVVMLGPSLCWYMYGLGRLPFQDIWWTYLWFPWKLWLCSGEGLTWLWWHIWYFYTGLYTSSTECQIHFTQCFFLYKK